jgi:hypothetical protein
MIEGLGVGPLAVVPHDTTVSPFLLVCCGKITATLALIGYSAQSCQTGGEMTHIGKKLVNPFARWPGRFAVTALMYALLPTGLWSSIGWAQEPTPQEGKPLDTMQTEPKRLTRAPAAKLPSSPKPTRVVVPGTDTISGGALATALASCDKRSGSSEPLTLPGAKGKIKLDRCYHGRDHLVCSFDALLTEAKALFNDYSKIVETDYPNIENIAAVCGIKPDDLAANLSNASVFDVRYKILKNEYALRANCGSRVEQSLRDVNLPNMARGPEILKSILDSMQAEMKDVVTMQKQVVDFADKIDAARKAMTTIQEIHPSICMRDQSVQRGADKSESPGQRSSETN